MAYQDIPKKKVKREDTPLASSPVVKWENNIKNPSNALNVNEVRNNRYNAIDAPKQSIIRKIFPKKVNQDEYNKFWDVKADSINTKK